MQPISAKNPPEIGRLLLYFTLIVATWMIVFGWNPNEMIAGHDGLLLEFVFNSDYIKTGGKWRSMLYRPDWLGGLKLYEMTGIPWYSTLFAQLQAPPHFVSNFGVLWIQTLYAFFGIRSISALLKLWGKKGSTLPLLLHIPLTWLFAFAPVIGWRLTHGHTTVAIASVLSVAAFTLLVTSLAGELSWVLLALSALLSYTCFESTMQQPILYGVVFGSPIFLAVLWNWKDKEIRAATLISGLTLVTGLLLALEPFSLLLNQARSGDAARSMESGSIVYSYLTGSLDSWIASLPWTRTLLTSEHPDFMQHEVNYPVGPLLLLLFLIPWKKNIALLLGFATSVLLVILFSDHIEPFSSFLLTMVPPLNAFRVPTRAALIFSLLLPILAISGFFYRWDFSKPRKETPLTWALIAVSFIGLWILPPAGREVALWIVTPLFCLSLYFNRPIRAVSPQFLLFVLGFGSVLALGERSLGTINGEQLISQTDRLRQVILAKVPELKSPLVRAYMDIGGIFNVNSAKEVGISTIDGYAFPLRRALALMEALLHTPFNPTLVSFHFPSNDPNARVLHQLYNIQYRISTSPQGVLQVEHYSDALGPAWFSENLEQSPDFPRLADTLMARQFTPDAIRKTALLIQADPAIPAEIAKDQAIPLCQNAQVLSHSTENFGQTFHFKIKTEANCPLTISTHYANGMIAYTSGDPQHLLKTFPIYGALTGIWVPAGTSDITLDVQTTVPFWAKVGEWIGGFLVLISGVMILTQQKILKIPLFRSLPLFSKHTLGKLGIQRNPS